MLGTDYGHLEHADRVNQRTDIIYAYKEQNQHCNWAVSQTQSFFKKLRLSFIENVNFSSFTSSHQLLFFSLLIFFCMWTTLLPRAKSTDCRKGCSRNTTGTECSFPHFLFCFFLSTSQVLVPYFRTYSTAQQAFAQKQHCVQAAQIPSEVSAPSFSLTPLYCSKTCSFSPGNSKITLLNCTTWLTRNSQP